MLKAKSILGDTAFVVRYDGNQPSEVWTSAEATRIGVLGEGQKTAVNVIPIKDYEFYHFLTIAKKTSEEVFHSSYAWRSIVLSVATKIVETDPLIKRTLYT